MIYVVLCIALYKYLLKITGLEKLAILTASMKINNRCSPHRSFNFRKSLTMGFSHSTVAREERNIRIAAKGIVIV